jgi:hypothetical protein
MDAGFCAIGIRLASGCMLRKSNYLKDLHGGRAAAIG